MAEGKREKQTIKKPMNKPQQVKGQIQVHRGNVDILTLKFLEQIAMGIGNINNILVKVFKDKLNG